MCANEVQFQLQTGYVNELKKNPANLQKLINQGSIIDNGDGTYSTTDAGLKSVGVFNVEGAGGVKKTEASDNTAPAKGLGVEHSVTQAKDGVKEEKTVTFKLDDFVKQSGVTEDKRAELVQEFEAAGLAIDKEKGVVTYDRTKYETAIAKFAKNNRLSYLSTNEDGKAIADKLVKDGNVKVGENGEYIINGADGKKAVDEAFPTQTQAPVETRVNKSVKINTKVTTTTVEESEPVTVAPNLKHNRAGRKETRKRYEAALRDWANKPENEFTMNMSIAEYKYGKKIDKKIAELSKEYNNKKSDVELLKDYVNNYATEDDKTALGKAFARAEKASDEDLLKAYRNGIKDKNNFKENLDDPADRKNAVIYYALQNGKFNKDVLIARMALVDVMPTSDEQKAKDKAEFIKEEAKRQTKAAETRQNKENTVIHFSKAGRKSAEKADKGSATIHTDIGKAGMELVRKAPDNFCVEGTESDHDNIPPKIVGYKDGKPIYKYYKFSQEKFIEFCDKACNSATAKEDANFGKDNNLTLNEGRDVMKAQVLLDRDGNPRSIEQLLGNKNGSVGNGELNKLRHIIESSSNSIDKNPTNAKRALNFFENMAAGAGIGAITGGLGTLAAGAVNIAGETASRMIGFSGVTDGQTIHDRTTFEYNIDGEKYSKVVDKYINVDGQKYSGEVEATGQKYADKGNNHLKTAANAALFGGIAGGVTGAVNMGKIHAKGKRFDGIVNLNNKIENHDTVDSSLSLEIPKFVTTEERSVETKPQDIQNFTYKIKVSHPKGTNYNLAEDRLSIVKKMYGIQDAATANKVLEYIMTKVNGYKKNPYKTNYAANLTYHFPSEIPAGMIDGIATDLVGQDPNKLSGFDRNKIILSPGGRNGANGSENKLNKPGRKVTAKIVTR